MTERYDVIIVGAGHNGLVCAALLAKAKKRVIVLEAAAGVGGAATTRSFAPEFSVSPCAHLLYQLQPQVCKDLGLQIDLAADNLQTVVLSESGEHVRYAGGSVSGVSSSDEINFRRFSARMNRFSDLLRRHLNRIPPRLGGGEGRDVLGLGLLGLDVRRLGRPDMREFLRLIAMNINDELHEQFDSALLRGGLSADAVLGTHLGPRSPTSMLTYLYRLAGNHGRLSVPGGGMGSVTDALAMLAQDCGATIRTDCKVQRIVVENGRIAGVETAAGERMDCLTVVSNVDPRRTVMDLVGARHFETRFCHRIEHLRDKGNAAKLHLALVGLPVIKGLGKKDFGNRLLIAASDDYVERAFNPSKYNEYSSEPVIEMTFPSVRDANMAPAGSHVMSAVVQYAPYDLKGGWTDAARKDFTQSIVASIARHAPDIERQIIATELLVPKDIESEFGIGGGHWHHADLAFDQFMFVRPVAGSAQYQLPIDGLFLCGAGAHPGGGISGAAGRNAARAVLRRESIV